MKRTRGKLIPVLVKLKLAELKDIPIRMQGQFILFGKEVTFNKFRKGYKVA